MVSYFENQKPFIFVLCLNFSIQTNIKTLVLIPYSNLSKQQQPQQQQQTNKQKNPRKQNEMKLQAHGFYLFEANEYRIKLMLINYGNLYKQTMTTCTSKRITGAKQNIEED